MQQTNVLKLQPRRLEQLRAIGGKLGLSMADTVAHLIRKEVAAGTIPPAIPGIVINTVKGGVSIQIDDGPVKTLSIEGARALVATIRGAVAGEPGVYEMAYGFMFMRRGSGYKLGVPFPGTEHSFSGDLALEIADQIEKAAA